MIFLFTRKNTIFSKLIRLFTGEEISHFVLYFQEYQIVFHSFRKGVELDWYERFSKNYEIIYRLKLEGLNRTEQDQVYAKIINKYLGKPYDFGALIFMSVYLAAKRWFGYAYEQNLWGSKNAFMCTEMIQAIRELNIIDDISWPDKLDTLTPKDLYNLLLTSKGIKDDSEPKNTMG